MPRQDALMTPLPTGPSGAAGGPDDQDSDGSDLHRPPRKQLRCQSRSSRFSGFRPCVSEDSAPLDDKLHASVAHGQCTLPVLLYDVAATSVQKVAKAADAHCFFTVLGLVDRVCGRQPSVFDCVAPFSLAAVTWNPGFLVTALSSRCREDTPASCLAACSLHWPHSLQQELAYRLALSAQHLPAIVFDDDDKAPPSYFVTHDPFQGPVGPHDDDAAEDDMTDSEPTMNCIEARIFCFQGPTRSVSLWFHLAEQVDEFLVRADILHNPDAEFLQLLPVVPHPDLPFMALLLVPRWWSTVGLTSALFVDELAGGRCFLHTAHAVETFEDALPPALLQGSTAVSLFVPPRHTEELDPVRPDTLVSAAISPGSVVVVQGVHDEAPLYVHVLDHLQSLPHSTERQDDAAGRHDPHPASVVLLGVAFEQYVLELRDGPTAAQVATALDYPEECLYLHRQPTGFERLVVAGVPVAESFGFRDTRVFGNVPGRGLFIDSRAVGRPVCYRCVQQRVLHAEDVCRMLDVQVPEGYVAHVAGGTSLQDGTAGFTTWHGETITVWLDFLIPPGSLSSPEGTDDDGHGSPPSSREGSNTSAAAPSCPAPRVSPSPEVARTDRSRSPRDSCRDECDPCAAEGILGPTSCLRPLSTPCRSVTTLLPVLENSTVDSVKDGCLPGHSPGGNAVASSCNSGFCRRH